ncbi:MAG: hypothetical protein JXR63_06940 [Spirochaetales bacterium]|nr:hypothetical protein [Spirochaetales bacterium]
MGLSKVYSKMDKIGQFWSWLIFTVLIIGISILTSLQPLWANIPFNVIIPILVLIFLKTVFFEKMKLSTLIIMRALIILAVFGVLPGDIYVKIVLVFMVINILEATFTDLKKKKYFNFITGILLAASTIPAFWWSSEWITADSAIWGGPYYHAEAVALAGTICWIIAYTIWNWIFVTNEFSPSIAYLHVGILFAPLLGIVCFMNPGLWMIFRANSLTIGGVFQISNKEFLEKKLENKKFSNFVDFVSKTSVQVVLMIINVALIAVPVVLTILHFLADKAGNI